MANEMETAKMEMQSKAARWLEREGYHKDYNCDFYYKMLANFAIEYTHGAANAAALEKRIDDLKMSLGEVIFATERLLSSVGAVPAHKLEALEVKIKRAKQLALGE